jgi:hypothetical protein
VPSGDVLRRNPIIGIVGFCGRRKRPRRRPTEKRNKLPPSNHEEFSRRVGLPSCFGLETSILAGGRAGSNRAVLTTAGWSARGTFRTWRERVGTSAMGGIADLRQQSPSLTQLGHSPQTCSAFDPRPTLRSAAAQ